CFTALAFLFTLIFFRKRTTAALWLMVSGWAWALQFRFEGALLGLLIFLMFYIDDWQELKSPRLYGVGLLLAILLSAHLLHLYAVRFESWGSSGAKMALNYIHNNLKSNTTYYFDGKRFPALFSLLALAALIFPNYRKHKLYITLWFLLTWGVF